jgi:predicted GIY-YIG superfamily endonuclease
MAIRASNKRAFCDISKLKHDLYRHFSADGTLLYIGDSLNSINRLTQHKQNADWFHDISRVEVEKFSNRNTALAAERRAIKTENPKHNIRLQRHDKMTNAPKVPEIKNDIDAIELLGRTKDRLTASLFEKYWYDEKESGEILRIHWKGIIQLYEKGHITGFSWLHEYEWRKEPRSKMKYRFSAWQLLEYLEAQHREADLDMARKKIGV